MTTAIRFFLSTAALVVFLVLPGFFAWGQYQAYAYEKLVAECISAQPAKFEPSRRAFECNESEIARLDFDQRSNIQSKVYYADDGKYWMQTFVAVAVSILALGALPLLWQLFLRMISDISKAIRGQI